MTNLLTDRNGSFNQGHHKPTHGGSGAPPNLWEVDWVYNGERIGPTGTPTALPELIVMQWPFQFPERKFVLGDDDFVLHGFWNTAMGYGFVQVLPAMPAGRYRFTAPCFPDQWHKIPRQEWETKFTQDQRDSQEHIEDGDHVQVRPSPQTSPDWHLGSECYIDARAGSAPFDHELAFWQDARRVPYGRYTRLEFQFDHPGGEMALRFGARGRWPFKSNGGWWDDLTLERIDADPIPPPPVPTPEPEPTPTPEPEPTPTPEPTPPPGNEILTLSILCKPGARNAIRDTILSNLRESPDVVSAAETIVRPPRIVVIYPSNALEDATFTANVIGEADRLGIRREVYRPDV